LSILQGNSFSITQKSGEIWTVQTDLQQIYPKSNRLLALCNPLPRPGKRIVFLKLRHAITAVAIRLLTAYTCFDSHTCCRRRFE